MEEPLKRRILPEWVGVAGLLLLALALRLVYVWQVKDASIVAPEELDPAG